LALALSFAALFGARGARADDHNPKYVCADDAERAQALRDARKLVDARALFLRCSQESCPRAVRRDCALWLEDIATRLPTIVPSARDEAGNDLSAVRVFLDGAPLASVLDGSPFPIDPGSHALRFEDGAGVVVELTVVAREGEQRRIVQATLTRPRPHATAERPPPAPAPPPRIPTLAYVAGGVGIVALGVATYAGIRGVSDYEHLSDTCAPACPHDDVTAVRTKFWVSTIAGAVSVVAISAAVFLTVSSKGTKPVASIFPLISFGGSAAGIGGRLTFD
jgi:hypothetical protein